MIGYLQGRIIHRQEHTLILNVHGIGYVVYINVRRMASWSDDIALWIETVVREHSMELYGFETRQEQNTFLQLQKVPGLGPKMAMLILSSFESLPELYHAIHDRQLSRFKAISGIGAKLATRIVQELQGLPAIYAMGTREVHESEPTSVNIALEALSSLGYDSSTAWDTLKRITQDLPHASAETYVKMALNTFLAIKNK
jgi:Holliday junction DNA helicase RuvA